ncbi:MAG: YdiU family protein [Chitinophagaceae bacterium]
MKLKLNNTFTKNLPADPIKENIVRQVNNACFSYTNPTPCSSPSIIHFSKEMLLNLGLELQDVQTKEYVNIFSGNSIAPNTTPFAMCYGGHQFGHWAGQLGDGRAINLFEINHNNQQWAIQLKGAGKTPYSRSADGLAVLRSSIREYLCSEAMHHLGVPTTRALNLVLSGDQVLRDILYNGHAAYEKGAIVTRVAPSFIRFGNFQIVSVRKEYENLKKLADYTITHFFSHLGTPNKEAYIAFFQEVAEKTMDMIVHWERVGFVHGVMNTDNMSILGLTIDYGPYGWLENYDSNWTPNTTDKEHRRYRFGNQAPIAFWNLYQLANALYPLIEDAKALEDILNKWEKTYYIKHHKMMLEKLGLSNSKENNSSLIADLKKLLEESEIDMTLFFRQLSLFDGKHEQEFIKIILACSYSENFAQYETAWLDWLSIYANEILNTNNPNRKAEMDATNPKYVLRNYMAQLAIDEADKGNYEVIESLFELLKHPYDEQTEHEKWFAKRPDWAKHKVGCSMLSCSS